MYANDANGARIGLLSDAQYALFAGLSKRQVQRQCAAGKIPGARKVGRFWKIPAAAVAEDVYSQHHRSGGESFFDHPQDAVEFIRQAARIAGNLATQVDCGEIAMSDSTRSELANETLKFGNRAVELHRALRSPRPEERK